MTAVKKVLVAVDFSSCSRDALREGARIAALEGASLSAVHVVRVPVMTPMPEFGFMPEVQIEGALERAHETWRRVAQETGLDPSVRCSFEVGRPQQGILDAVSTQRPNLLIVGAHGSTDAWRHIGFVAVSCIQHCASPVLVVRQGHAGPFRKVLACVDLSETARRALDEAIRVAVRDGAALDVLHLFADPWDGRKPPAAMQKNVPDFRERYRAAVEERVREFLAPVAVELQALKAQLRVEMAPDHGFAIVTDVRERGFDLVTIGTRAKWNARDFFLGSTAERVVRGSPCSVLAVKPPGFEQP